MVGGKDAAYLFDLIARWQRFTFPATTPEGALNHLEKEVGELRQRPGDGQEMADCVFMLIQLAGLAGVDLLAEVERKFVINMQREWPAKPDAQGVYEHVKPGEPSNGGAGE